VENSPESDFADAIAGHDHEVDLFGGAVAIARLGRDDVDGNALARELDLIAETVRGRGAERAGAVELAGAITAELFEERGFRGNREHYTDPRNSYIDEVIERRLGIPITLSLVYMEVAQRVGLECDGIGFPGHFLIRCGGDDGFYLDPFNAGEQPTREDLEGRLEGHTSDLPSIDSLLAAVTRRQILQRMLVNLCVAYQGEGDAPRWIDALGFRLRLEPWNAALYMERGLLYYQQGEEALALADLERYVGSGEADLSPRTRGILDHLRLRLGREGGES
jgi:regulator of sirC expression with transglutaminase-like and TPR domain